MIGKYFICVHDAALRSGIIDERVNDHHYLVRFDEFIGFSDGSKFPESLAVVPVCDMVGYKDPPPWLLFDTIEQRAAYHAWLDQPPADKPRVDHIRSLQ
jgi:hypothetical protein